MKNIYINYIASQLKKPTGFIGHIVSNKMQKMNEPIYDWMISVLNIERAKNVLEIGYGTGIMMNRIVSNYKNVKVYGIDFSKIMFDKAKFYNDKYIKQGRIHLDFGDLLSYNSSIKFDVVFGLNVIYFWNKLTPYFEKIFSLMNTGGVLYLYMRDTNDFKNHQMAKTVIFNMHDKKDIRTKMESCGFNQVNFIEMNLNGMKCCCIKAIK
jgi:cyclopropane fatty-acyl-phospholipid synthase-like methyltransferase